MAETSTIEWTDATWNVITGCSVISPGCRGCYAMKLAGTRLQHHPSRAGLTQATSIGPVWNGQVRFNMEWLHQPLQWKRPREIFVCAHGDLFHESVPDLWIADVFGVMHAASWHTFQVLTKRASRMCSLLNSPAFLDLVEESAALHTHTEVAWPLRNVRVGVSLEDQTRANERIPELLSTPASVRWVSAEPLLGPVDLGAISYGDGFYVNTLHMQNTEDVIVQPAIDWVVAGGESGRNARPMHPDWARSLRDQCARAGVPFHFKQWGEWAQCSGEQQLVIAQSIRAQPENHSVAWPDGTVGHGDSRLNGGPGRPLLRIGKKAAGRRLDGVEHNGVPGSTR